METVKAFGENMSLIVNADDFGKSREVNNAIVECFKLGYINRTTIMVNMPYAEEACELAKEHGFFDKVGLHINLTEGKPMSGSIRFNTDFCDESGVFNAAFYKSKLKRLKMSKEEINDIVEEIKTQLDKYAELGFTLNHIDSHHHVHTNYPVYKALKRLSLGYDFSSIRLSRNLYKGGSFLNRVYKVFYNKKISRICARTEDYFGSFRDAIDYFAADPDETFIDSTSEYFKEFCYRNDLEIMVHPMYKDNVLVDTDIPFTKEILLYEARK